MLRVITVLLLSACFLPRTAAAWDPAVLLSDTANTYASYYPSLSRPMSNTIPCAQNPLGLAWYNNSGNKNIIHTRFCYNGLDWGRIISLDADSDAIFPKIAFMPSDSSWWMSYVCHDTGAFYVSVVRGDTVSGWGQPERVGYGAQYPLIHSITCSDSVAWVSFDSDTGGTRQVYCFSTNGSSSSEVVRISDNDHWHGFPDIVERDNGEPVIVWNDIDTFALDYRLVWSTRQKSWWTVPQTLISMTGATIFPRILHNAGSTGTDWHTIWQNDSTGRWQIFSANDTNGQYLRITDDTLNNNWPVGLDLAFMIEQNEVPYLVAWCGNDEIYCKRWSGLENISQSVSVDERPDVSCAYYGDLYNIWIVWESNRGSRWGIYGSHEAVSPGGVTGGPGCGLGQRPRIWGVPNPFNDRVEIRMSRMPPENKTLYIYNITGQRINTIIRSESGRYIWDGRDYNCKKVGSGVYLIGTADVTTSTFIRLVCIK